MAVDRQIVKVLKFNNSDNVYQIDAVTVGGMSVDEIVSSVTTDTLVAGSDEWVLNCGTSAINN